MPDPIIEYHEGLTYGVGVDTASGDARNIAVTGTPSTILDAHGSTISFYIRQVTSVEDLETHLGISASASGGVGLFSASARAEFAKSCNVHSESVFLISKVKVNHAFSQIDKPGIDPTAAGLLANGRTDLFQQRFGDMFVRGLNSGGQFFGVIQIVAQDQREKSSLQASVTAAYGGFAAKGEVSFDKTFQDAVSTHQTIVTCHIEGGDDSIPVPRTVDTMMNRAASFPGELKNTAVPYSALLNSYTILPLPALPNYFDLQQQKDVLTECAHLRSATLMQINEIDYIINSPDEYPDSAKYSLGDLRNSLNSDLDTIATAASFAFDHPKEARAPQLKAGKIDLPTRVISNPISDLYELLGGENSVLGSPSPQKYRETARDGVGRYRQYEKGRIFWSPATGAHEVHGDIYDKWASLDREGTKEQLSLLGYPVSNEKPIPPRSDGTAGSFNSFERGTIYMSPQTGAHEMHGLIEQEWKAIGREQSVLGYPVSDEMQTSNGDGQFQEFQGGSIYCNDSTGAHAVTGAIRDKWKSVGAEKGPLSLGYPTSDEEDYPGHPGDRLQTFQNGFISWRPDFGAGIVYSDD